MNSGETEPEAEPKSKWPRRVVWLLLIPLAMMIVDLVGVLLPRFLQWFNSR
jgi:hypothetical protein